MNYGRNNNSPETGCPRIAQQIMWAFGAKIDKDVVRRILSVHYRPESDSGGSSWLTFLGHMKHSLWSCDLFRCESATLRTHWVLLVMDQFTRRIVGFGVQGGIVDGAALCQMFKRAIRGQTTPNYLGSDNDQHYYNEYRTHAAHKGHPPVTGVNADRSLANLSCYRWQKHCRGLYQTPIAA
jgi:transposase InsO family protein